MIRLNTKCFDVENIGRPTTQDAPSEVEVVVSDKEDCVQAGDFIFAPLNFKNMPTG